MEERITITVLIPRNNKPALSEFLENNGGTIVRSPEMRDEHSEESQAQAMGGESESIELQEQQTNQK